MIIARAGDGNSKSYRVWLEEEEVTSKAFYAELPDNPGEEAKGMIGMYSKDSEGKFITFGREKDERQLVEIWKDGMIRWERIKN